MTHMAPEILLEGHVSKAVDVSGSSMGLGLMAEVWAGPHGGVGAPLPFPRLASHLFTPPRLWHHTVGAVHWRQA